MPDVKLTYSLYGHFTYQELLTLFIMPAISGMVLRRRQRKPMNVPLPA
jgi:hypothetical protein